MATPGFFAEAALYVSSRRYRSGLSNAQAVGRIRILRKLTAQDQQCNSAAVSQCITDAGNALQQELADCNDLPTPQEIAKCRVQARNDYKAAVAQCDPCPAGTRCESNVCCPNDQVTCAPPCSFLDTATAFTVEFNFPQGAFLYNRQSVYDKTNKNLSDAVVISKEAQPLITWKQSLSSSGAIVMNFDYGPMFSGLQHATFSSADGVTFVGTIDGRQTVAFTAKTDPGTITFQDGGSLPSIGSTTPGLIDQVSALLEAAQNTSISSCNSLQPARARARPDTFVGCDSCKLNCGIEYAYCNLGVITGTVSPICDVIPIFGNIVCAVGGAAECVKTDDDCSSACEAPGHPCCPVACSGNICCEGGDVCCGESSSGNSGCCTQEECCSVSRDGIEEKFCCYAGEVCVDPINGVCCPPGAGPVCGSTCCPAGQTCAEPSTSLCCPAGTRKCGESTLSCCPNDLPCYGDQCCSNEDDKDCGGCCPRDTPCIDNECCSEPKHACGGECCPPLNQCCNNQCCELGQRCHPTLGTCCSVVCGPSCCAEGQFCQEPGQGICGGCATGQHACVGPLGVPHCCQDGTDCCANGQCCPQGTCCCGTQTGWECRPLSDVCCTPR
jgi:hypothetical protein